VEEEKRNERDTRKKYFGRKCMKYERDLCNIGSRANLFVYVLIYMCAQKFIYICTYIHI